MRGDRCERSLLGTGMAEVGRESPSLCIDSVSLAACIDPAADEMLVCELDNPEVVDGSRLLCLLRWLCGASGDDIGTTDVRLSVRR